ncbi:MAG: hypothetical protein ABI678_05535 [Kofleriaceae bacterium]
MQLVWSLIVAWCMVASAAPHGPRDQVRRSGISVAPAFHHPVRQREMRHHLAPFVAPERTPMPTVARAWFVIVTPLDGAAIRDRVTTPVARGPPEA